MKTTTTGLPMEFLAITTLVLSPVLPTFLGIQKENWGGGGGGGGGGKLLLCMV